MEVGSLHVLFEISIGLRMSGEVVPSPCGSVRICTRIPCLAHLNLSLPSSLTGSVLSSRPLPLCIIRRRNLLET